MSQDERIKALEGQVEELRGRVKVLEEREARVDVYLHQPDTDAERFSRFLEWMTKHPISRPLRLPAP